MGEACQSKFNFCSPLQASTSTMPAAKEVFIAVIGAGGVGKCFLSQLEGLSKRSSSKLSLIFVSRSKTALLQSEVHRSALRQHLHRPRRFEAGTPVRTKDHRIPLRSSCKGRASRQY